MIWNGNKAIPYVKGDPINGTTFTTEYNDVCLNVAQVKQFWPEFSSLEPNEMQLSPLDDATIATHVRFF